MYRANQVLTLVDGISSTDSELNVSFDELDKTGYEKDESDTESDPEGDIEQEL